MVNFVDINQKCMYKILNFLFSVGVSRPSVFNQGDSATGSVTDFLSRLQSDGKSNNINVLKNYLIM